MPKAIQGGATVSPTPPLITVHATWDIDVEKRCATASILGGVATISRRPDDAAVKPGAFQGVWVREISPTPDPEDLEADEDGKLEDGLLRVSVPLHSCTSFAQAQERCEVLIRENLQKTRPDIYMEAAKAEQVDRIESKGEDPF